VIFVDSNIPMYLVGRDDTMRTRAQHLLEVHAVGGEALVTDVEVFQEILHRYQRVRGLEAIDPAFEALHQIVDEVLPVEYRDIERARRFVLGTTRMSARDAIHAAVMQGRDIATIMSFDTGFDIVPGIRRLS
jgi:predicted nucleic acid-binding protein